MDRTQYGQVSVGNIYRPFDLARREKPLPGYALLADLQSHTAKSASPGGGQNAVYSSSQKVEQRHTQPEVIYQNETPYKQDKSINGYASDRDMYKHETREEIRTETHSSGPDMAPPRPPAVTSNLSELDSLLHDLNNAKRTGVFKDNTISTGARPSVDALLNELNKVESSTKSYNHTSTARVRTPSPVFKSASASNATRELDDLMANLSDFKREDVIRENSNLSVQKSSNEESSKRASWMEHYYGTCPPRPPAPTDLDVFVVPPPRPPPPQSTIPTDDTVLPTATPLVPTHKPKEPNNTLRVTHRRTEVNEDEVINPILYGGPVKRNDLEYRWVTDQTKPEIRAIIDDPFEEPEIEEQPIQAIPFLQARVETTYAKPQKPRTPSPEPPNQLDSMLGSLTSHMTDQGVTTTPKGQCNACDKPIVGSVITALGKPWHPEHFVCAECQLELGTKNFFERDGKPYCEPDYHALFSPKCAYCSSAILDKCVTALNKTWHPEHFFCAQCGNTFGEDGFHEKTGKPYCRECYHSLFAPKCGGCNAPIMENYISALNAQWHPECFVCRDCRQPFNGGSFFDHEGLPYCETHYHEKRGSLCYGCHKPITGRCITAMFRKYHPEHFVCSFCLQQLNKGTFKEQNDKPYCHGCFDKLFG